MENNDSQVTPEIKEEPKKTFDELLKNPEYQAEFDKKLEGARQKWLSKWNEDAEKKRTEAENFARMSEEEKQKVAMDKLNTEKQNAIDELNAYKLKDEAQKIATEKGLPVGLLDAFDFRKETAESLTSKIDTFTKEWNKALETGVNDKLKQPSPKQVYSATNGGVDKNYLDSKYKNNPYYKG